MSKSVSHVEESPDAFDSNLERLRSIVEIMEQGGVNLAQSLELFEEGIGLAGGLLGVLDRSESRVELLLANMERVPFRQTEDKVDE
jgi:exodeoxyribonuclease VII small subunit